MAWLYPEDPDSYLSCRVSPKMLEKRLCSMERKPVAVYLTSPDYLGELADVAGVAEVCHRYGILLLVDNAHGAYLRFLEPSQHPVDLGADICCDSAHKTLPVLTGGAYLHLAGAVWSELGAYAKQALAMFGSTSPSYLILQSLDGANAYLEGYRERLFALTRRVSALKRDLRDAGYVLTGQEQTKITIRTKPYGYTGTELAQILLKKDLVCEFADPDYLVLMLSPETGEGDLHRLRSVLLDIPKKPAITRTPPIPAPGERVLSIRNAMLSRSEQICVEASVGRILASPSVGCPPAVPILVCGERIDQYAVECFRYYGISAVSVVKESAL